MRINLLDKTETMPLENSEVIEKPLLSNLAMKQPHIQNKIAVPRLPVACDPLI